MENYKFKVGDIVKSIKSGSGLPYTDKEKIVKVIELGKYIEGEEGVKVDPPIGNSKSGDYNGFIGVTSFELVKKAEFDLSQLEIF